MKDEKYYIPSRTIRFSNIAFDSDNSKRVIGYFCFECKQFNHILTCSCSYCNLSRPIELHDSLLRSHFDRIDFDLISLIRGKTLDDKQALHARFYDEEKKLISSMTDDELELHLEEWATIAFEARARTTANQDEVRERKGRKSSHERNLLQKSDSEFDTDSAIGTINARKKRMSRADKDFEAMKKLLGVEGASELLGKIDKTKYNPTNSAMQDRVDKLVQVPTSELCRIDRHGECPGKYRIDKVSHNCQCTCHNSVFDPSNLFPSAVSEANLGLLTRNEPTESSSEEITELKPFNPDDLFK